MAEDRLTTLYAWSEAMTAAGDQVKEKHEEDYNKIIDYLKTSKENKERIFAAQLIARFFKFFPELEDVAFDPIVDLCESPDVDVRKHATLAMISICRGSKQVVSKAADILIQLYQTDQPSEVTLINQSLTQLLNLNIEQFLKSFFANFEDGNELVRERALKFLSSKLHMVPEEALTKEVEEQLMTYTKKAMEDVTKEEFISFINILSKLKISKTNTGQATLMSAIKTQAELDKPFDVNDKEKLDKFLLCTKNTLPFLSLYNRASEYVNYICLNMLPHLSELTPTGHDLNVLQVLAEMSPFIIPDDIPSLINLDECQKAVHSKLMEYLPLPPEAGVDAVTIQSNPASAAQPSAEAQNTEPQKTEETNGDVNAGDQQKAEGETPAEGEEQTTDKDKAPAEAAPPATTTTKTTTPTKTPSKPQEVDFQFTHIEYLMHTFVQLCRHKPELYTEAMQVENRKQLSHLSNGCKKYTDALERQLTSVKRQDLNKEENKLRSIALRTTKNISTMILGLFKRPADFKTTIILSCKPVKLETAPAPATNASNNNNSNYNSNNKSKQGGGGGGGSGGYNRNNGGGYRGSSGGRQAGQKSKFKGNYQSDYRGKRPRNSR